MKCSRISSAARPRKLGFRAVWLCGVVLVLVALLSICLGSVALDLADLWRAPQGQECVAARIVLYVRLPRILAALLAGAGLSVAGVIIQAVLSNPLAGPNIIGVNAGAGLFYVLCVVCLPSAHAAAPVAAFLGALFAMGGVWLIASRTGASRITLVLAGVVINALLGAAIDALVTLVPDALQSSTAFRVGGVAGVSLAALMPAGILIVVAALIAMLLHNELDVLTLGAEMAHSLGLPAGMFRFLFLALASVLAGASVSFAGLLGFVGLIIPHAARFLVGSESRLLLPVSGLMGGAFVVFCDVLARIVFAPFELPVGIVMSFIGAPCFIWLLLRRKGERA